VASGSEDKVVATAEGKLSIADREARSLAQRWQARNAQLWHHESPQLYWLRTTVVENGLMIDDQYTRVRIRRILLDKDSASQSTESRSF